MPTLTVTLALSVNLTLAALILTLTTSPLTHTSQYPYDRVGVSEPCGRTPRADPMPPDPEHLCANISVPEIERLENIVRRNIPDVPPERAPCSKGDPAYVFCIPNMDTGATIYLSECPKDVTCKKESMLSTSQPWLGFFGSTPHNIAFADNADETLDQCVHGIDITFMHRIGIWAIVGVIFNFTQCCLSVIALFSYPKRCTIVNQDAPLEIFIGYILIYLCLIGWIDSF